MSDRIAVFNKGRIEQIGTPTEIYEKPSTMFVAGFVGTSNVLSGEQAQRVLGSDGTYALRPEKVHIAEVDTPVSDGRCCVTGIIRDVIYLGINTRYVVDLDMGGEMIVVEQNLRVNSVDVASSKGRKVALVWQRDDTHKLQG